MSLTVKCISIRQPFAHLILHGGKDVENRTWRTYYRGPLLIHAGLEWWRGQYPPMPWNGDFAWQFGDQVVACPQDAPRGGILGLVYLRGCVQGYDSEWAEHDPEIWHWLLGNPVVFAKPIAYKGRQGLFDVPLSALPLVPCSDCQGRGGECETCDGTGAVDNDGRAIVGQPALRI